MRLLNLLLNGLCIGTANANSVSFPLTRIEGIAPVTKTQKLLQEHRLEKHGHQMVDVRLVNYSNLAYVGPVYFTDQFQGSENGHVTAYVYDSGSGDLTTTSKNCASGC